MGTTPPIMRKKKNFFHYGHLRRPSWSPKVTTMLQRRALAMDPRYIFVVPYQISSNMVASATAPPLGSFWFFLFVFHLFALWSLQGWSRGLHCFLPWSVPTHLLCFESPTQAHPPQTL